MPTRCRLRRELHQGLGRRAWISAAAVRPPAAHAAAQSRRGWDRSVQCHARTCKVRPCARRPGLARGRGFPQIRVEKNEVGSVRGRLQDVPHVLRWRRRILPDEQRLDATASRALYIDRGQVLRQRDGRDAEGPGVRVQVHEYHARRPQGLHHLGRHVLHRYPELFALSSLNPVSVARKFLPAYLQIDERRQTIEGTVTQTFGKTTALLSLVGTRIDNRNRGQSIVSVGELQPFPAIPANPVTVVPAPAQQQPEHRFRHAGVEGGCLESHRAG